MYSASSLLLVLSSALLASSFVVERGYVPPDGMSYCQDLLSHLNAHHRVMVDLDQCSGRTDWSNDKADLLNPDGMLCADLVARIRALGIKVDVNVCKERRHGVDGGDDDDDDEYNEGRCRAIVARLNQLKGNANANVCAGKKFGKGVLGSGRGNNGDRDRDREHDDYDYSDLSCDQLTRLGRIIGVKVDREICLDSILGNNDRLVSLLPANRQGHGHSHDHDGDTGDSDGEYDQACPGIVARLRLLGLDIKADVCLQSRRIVRLSKDEIQRMKCEGVVAHAKALGILKGDIDICLGDDPHGVNSQGSGEDEYNECDDIAARLRLLGIKLKADICLGVKGVGGWTKGATNHLSCDDIVAHAKVLRILKADVNICLNNIPTPEKSTGTSSRDTSDGEYNECDDIAAYLRLLGIKLDTNICTGVRGAGDWSRSSIDRLKCEDIAAHAKKLGILRADINVCLHNALSLDRITNVKKERYNECENIIARLRVFGIHVAADICLGIKVDGRLRKEEIGKMGCEEITAHAKALHMVKADVVMCLEK